MDSGWIEHFLNYFVEALIYKALSLYQTDYPQTG